MSKAKWSFLALILVLLGLGGIFAQKHNNKLKSGYCLAEKRYLTETEIVDKAITGLITRMSYEFQESSPVEQGKALFATPLFTKFTREEWNNIYQFDSAESFKDENPNCCKLMIEFHENGIKETPFEKEPYFMTKLKFKDLKNKDYSEVAWPTAEVWVKPCGRPAVIKFTRSIFEK